MRVLLFGRRGQVGRALENTLNARCELIALDRQGSQGLSGDVCDFDSLRITIEKVRPEIIINAAAYTAVDKAEDDANLARRVNAEAVAVLAEEALKQGSTLVHYSSDYVFDGSGNLPWREEDATTPLNLYGLTKLEGERAIRQSGCDHFILRTSWVYGSYGNNFIQTILDLARTREELSVVEDQVGAPTSAQFLADTTHKIISTAGSKDLAGTYHIAASGEVSWYSYACFVIEQAKAMGMKLAVKCIKPVPSGFYKTRAIRPMNSRLDTSKVQRVFDLSIASWQVDVKRVVTGIVRS